MENKVKRVGRELAYEGTILKVYKDYMEFENGNKETWDYIYLYGAAAVVPVLEDGRILMVKQYRSAIDRETLEIPAGKLDGPEEKGIVCAKRELQEETGYKTEMLEWLITIRTTAALCNEKIDIYVAKNLVESKRNLDENEYVDVYPFTISELKEKIFSGEIQDSKTVAAILAYEDKYLKK